MLFVRIVIAFAWIIVAVVTQLEYKWEHTPTRHRPEPMRQYGLATYAQWVELFLDWLLVADYKLDEMIFAAMLGEDFLPWVQQLQEVLSLPRLYEVIEQAIPEAWEQARLDYMTLCQFFQTISAPLEQEGDPEEPDFSVFAFGGFFLVPVALAIRQRGYGYWIDDGFSWVNKWLTNPDTQKRLTKMSELLADSETRARLTEPEVYMWIIKQLP